MIKPGMFISDRYEIIDKVGSGGMADVYKARCHRLNRFVAIKILKTEFSDDKSFVAKFRAEAQSVAGLSHPNIVNVYDVGEDNGLYYIVMELVEGITLKSFIERKGKLEVKEAVGIAIQIAQGMEAAHDNHIVHRDIKPQNIIISREGKVKVTDFGIAKAVTSNTITSNAMGSVHYISPEQARGGYSDEKSDIYSLGITLYEMLSGKVPFAGDNTVSVALLHIQGEAVPLRELGLGIPMSVDNIVEKCIQKKPERRYLSASELISDLKRSISNPNGDFVKVAPAVIPDSPTISLSDDEINQIKSESKIVKNPYEQEKSERANEPEDFEEEESDVDPKLEKFMVVGSVVAAIILGIIVIVLIGKAFGLFSFGGNSNKKEPANQEEILPDEKEEENPSEEEKPVDVIAPNVTGETFDNASKTLNDMNINFKYERKYSDFEKDYVIEQSIAEGTKIEPTDIMILTISDGAQAIKVPDVYNRSDAEAITMIEEAGLIAKHDYQYDDTVEEGKVVKTIPERGSEVKKEASVTIVLSRGKETVMKKVPDIRGMSESKGIAALKEAGLAPGKVTTKFSEEIEKGLIIDQSYSINTEVAEGTVIDYSVSKGPEEKEYTYVGTVKIDENPFTEEITEGTILLSLEQDGMQSKVYESVETADSFPLTRQIIGDSESEGKVRMYLDGELCPGTWIVNFTKVEK